jgi:predicted O-methyltransferase YrrM
METPPLVLRVLARAEAEDMGSSCQADVGALLHVLAARRGLVRAAEIGTGAGGAAAWIVSALQPQLPFFTAEPDLDLAARAAELFADDPNVVVLPGPWRASLPPEAPFDLLFVDAPDAKDDVEAVVGLLAPGGTAVLGVLRSDPALQDARRDAWLYHPLLTTIELHLGSDRSALIAVRR